MLKFLKRNAEVITAICVVLSVGLTGLLVYILQFANQH